MDSVSCSENRFLIFLSLEGTCSTFAYFSTSSEQVTGVLAWRCRRGKEVARCKQAHCCVALFTRANGALSSKQQWTYSGKTEGSALATCVLSLLLLSTLLNLSQTGCLRILHYKQNNLSFIYVFLRPFSIVSFILKSGTFPFRLPCKEIFSWPQTFPEESVHLNCH